MSETTADVSLDDLVAEFRRHGETDEGYGAHHFSRFKETKNEVCRSWPRDRGVNVLDVGAHWLHQSYLWARDGFNVTAMDLPATFDLASVQSLAAAQGIRLVGCSNLEAARELEQLPESSIQLVLFTEILEHITFNPVAFWTQIYRVLAPGGRIIVTTPNYYWHDGRVWDFKRFREGFAGGLPVDEVIFTPTYGHHWREYSMREVIKYFCMLSPDFNVVKAIYPTAYQSVAPRTKRSAWLQARVPILRQNMHLEVEVLHKTSGITAVPRW